MIVTDIKSQLIRDEGESLTMYPDDRGWMTNGIGHWLGTKDPNAVPINMRQITQAQEDALFAADLSHECALLNVWIPWWSSLDGPTGPRSGVLINQAFNLGAQGLAAFHGYLAYMQTRNWEAAANDLRNNTAVYKELPERYERLAQQILLGVWK